MNTLDSPLDLRYFEALMLNGFLYCGFPKASSNSWWSNFLDKFVFLTLLLGLVVLFLYRDKCDTCDPNGTTQTSVTILLTLSTLVARKANSRSTGKGGKLHNTDSLGSNGINMCF